MALYITVPDMNDSFSRIVLDQKEYKIRFTYNGAGDYWTFGIYDSDKNIVMQHRKIVPSSPLNHFDIESNQPAGLFGCFTNLEKVGRNAFRDGNAKFAYIPWTDLEDWSERNGIIR